jgi:hypothetical protein
MIISADVRHTLVAAWYEALWSVYIVGYLFRLEFSVNWGVSPLPFHGYKVFVQLLSHS